MLVVAVFVTASASVDCEENTLTRVSTSFRRGVSLSPTDEPFWLEGVMAKGHSEPSSKKRRAPGARSDDRDIDSGASDESWHPQRTAGLSEDLVDT